MRRRTRRSSRTTRRPARARWRSRPAGCARAESRRARDPRAAPERARRRSSDLHELLLLAFQHLVDLRDELVGDLLQLALGAMAFVLGGLAFLDVAIDLLFGVPPHVADRYATVFG